MEKTNDDQIVSTLAEFVSENKQHLVDQVLQKRTRHITLVFEDIDKPHNISAVLRTAECMGIQDVHFIKNQNDYTINPAITQGAAKWLTMHHYRDSGDNIAACYQELRSQGYSIYATSLHETSRSIEELDASQKTAIVFGTEADGISKEAGEQADGYVHIPMAGFTESYNLSVSAALCLNTLGTQFPEGFPPISEEHQLALRAEWYRKIVREADLILKTKGVEV